MLKPESYRERHIVLRHSHCPCACLLVSILLFARSPAHAQDTKQIVAQAVQAELQADRTDHSHWLYYENDRKPGNSVKQWVAETRSGELMRVLERNGQPVAAEQQRQDMEKFIGSPDAQSKQRQDDEHDDKQASDLLKLLPDAFVWTDTGTHGRNKTLHFRPDPNFNPPSHEARVFAAMEGDMVVSTSQHRIVSLKGRLVHDVKFGLGLLGDLKSGGTFDVERRNVGKNEWRITETHVHVHGHELLFKSISEEEDDVKSRFKPLPGNLSLQQAEAELLKQGAAAP